MNVTSIAISIGTFILGFAANKLLDWITGVASKQLKKRTIDCNFHDFYNGAHRDIVITSSGFPFFSPFNIKASLNSEKTFLLAVPVGIDREDKEWIYVSVTEALSETDFDEETGAPDISKTVFRGIHEELGIKEIQLKSDTLRFYESFYETNFHQDNIVASIELSETLSFKDIAELLAKDKFMEIRDVIPLPKNKKEIATFIENNEEQMRSQTIFTLESFMARLEE